MELKQKQEIMALYGQKLKKAIDTEKWVLRELESDKATLVYITGKKESGEELENSIYSSYDEWIENIERQIKVGQNTLKNIAFKKIELEAVEYFATKQA